MEKIFEIASNISTPLALAGIITAILFFIIKQILQKKGNTESLFRFIINKLFILSLIAMLLGFAGFIIKSFDGSDTGNKKKTYWAIIYVDDKLQPDIHVIIPEWNQTESTSTTGKFEFQYNQSDKEQVLTLIFQSPLIKDTSFRSAIEKLPDVFKFTSINNTINSGDYFFQEPYTGNCKSRPSGSTCLGYDDGYIWLIYDVVLGWDKINEVGKNSGSSQVAMGRYGNYYHILGTKFVKKKLK